MRVVVIPDKTEHSRLVEAVSNQIPPPDKTIPMTLEVVIEKPSVVIPEEPKENRFLLIYHLL